MSAVCVCVCGVRYSIITSPVSTHGQQATAAEQSMVLIDKMMPLGLHRFPPLSSGRTHRPTTSKGHAYD